MTSAGRRGGHWKADDLPDLQGQTIIVTGAARGLGWETAKSLAGAGAHVVLAVRDVTAGQRAAADVSGSTEVRRLDLADLASVRSFAEDWDAPIDVLINNAGIMAPPKGITADGFELQLGTNHLGHFLLTNLLLPSITSRVVTVSSQLHVRAKLDLDDLNWERRTYEPAQAYADSKLANLLFTLELQRQLEHAGSSVTAVSAHPGVASTHLSKTSTGALGTGRFFGWLFSDPERAALSLQYAATQPIPGNSYVGPDGIGHLRGYPQVHQPSKLADDPETARRLWAASARLTSTAGRFAD